MSSPLFTSFICCLFFLSSLTAEVPSVYRHIQDIRHPTIKDYQRIQWYLLHGKRKLLNRLDIFKPRVRSFLMIGKKKSCFPRSGRVVVNSTESDRENCVILYSSFNKNYPGGLRKLLHSITTSDFRGHVLYRLGGWPNVEEGSLVLAHVPYAFKPCFFKEAKRLGYKRVLWLDTSILPLVSLNTIFDGIKEKGYFIMGNTHTVGPYMNVHAAKALGITVKEAYHIPSCSAGLFGVDFTQTIPSKIIDRWYKAASDPEAYFSGRSEQSVLSVILYQFGISDFVHISRLAHSKDQIQQDSLFLIDREFVKQPVANHNNSIASPANSERSVFSKNM